MMGNHIIYNGRLLSAETPIASANSRALLYGEGVFETIRTYRGQTLLFEEHINRLKKGLKKLGISLHQFPGGEILKKNILRLLTESKLLSDDAIIRCQFWRSGNRGYLPDAEEEIHYLLTVSKCPAFKNKEVHLSTVSTLRIPSESLPVLGKFTNGINYVLAAKEAAEKGADDALMQTTEGWVSETTIANIFWIEGKRILTPSEDCDLLPGITRNAIMDIITEDNRLVLEEGKYPIKRVYEAESVFICNSVREVLSVNGINNHNFDTDHPVIDILQRQYLKFRKKHKQPLAD